MENRETRTATVKSRLTEHEYDAGQAVLDVIGISTSDYIRLCWRQLIVRGSIPLELIAAPFEPDVLKLPWGDDNEHIQSITAAWDRRWRSQLAEAIGPKRVAPSKLPKLVGTKIFRALD